MSPSVKLFVKKRTHTTVGRLKSRVVFFTAHDAFYRENENPSKPHLPNQTKPNHQMGWHCMFATILAMKLFQQKKPNHQFPTRANETKRNESRAECQSKLVFVYWLNF